VRSLTAHDTLLLNSRTPEERVTGRTPDISEYAHYAWFDWVLYRNETSFPEPDLLLGKWLGVATKEGQVMTYWILTDKGKVIARSSVAHLPDLDRRDPERTAEQDQFMTKICQIKNYDPNIKGPIFQQSELDINDDIPD